MVQVTHLSAVSQGEGLLSSSTLVFLELSGDFNVNDIHNVSVFQEGDGEMEVSSLRRTWPSCHPFELESC